MPIARYGVLKGSVQHRVRPMSNKDHYEILVSDGTAFHRVAVNVLSKEKPPELLFFSTSQLPAALRTALKKLDDGFTAIESKPAGLAIDYVRSGLVKKEQMKVVPNIKPGPKNDLGDMLDDVILKAAHQDKPRLYAFGQQFGPDKKRDPIFDFDNAKGMHDIHMNQGNTGKFKKDDGIFQDGALILQFPKGTNGDAEVWIAVFCAFQSQSWDTDEQGHARKTKPAKPSKTVAKSVASKKKAKHA